ncbi:hypothetical protein [Methanolobus halotolerans]|uniref:Uncharacterized protein n=1 Tax=Methanolobus halotolerans TaxID=2052935 RepID=A0A4E0QXW1_9EURY|nr:hypothetical protein [Methanolobus halotolerans]TGC08318.1 hypothetical protein CUN85_09575 [Methanolobus halotolerans]
MGLIDVIAGVATGGLYTLGKSIYQAGNAAEDAGDAAEQAGLAIAVIGSTIETLGEQLVSTLEETEELLTVNRLTPRSEDDLWDEEKARLDSLKQEKTRLLNKLSELGVEDPSNFNIDFWDMVSDMQDILKQFRLIARLAAVNKEIHDIFYQEPGILSTGIYNAKEVLERFNTVEQPMVEDILASVDDNLEVSGEVLQEVKKLFITKKKVPVPVSELIPSIRDQLEAIDADKLYYEKLLERKSVLTSGIADVIKTYPENTVKIDMGTINVPKEDIYDAGILDDLIDIGGVYDGVIDDGTIADEVTNPGGIADDIIDSGKEHGGVINPGDIYGKDTGIDDAHDIVTGPIDNSSVMKDKEIIKDTLADSVSGSAKENFIRKTSKGNKTLRTMSAETPAATGMAIKNISSLRASKTRSGGRMAMMQPHGARISASLNTRFDGYQRNYDLLKAQKAFYYRQTLKLDKEYELLANEWIEEPGIVPKTLDELHGVLSSIRTEEQPRIDLLLDNINANLEESKQTISNANDTMGSVRNALSILDFDTRYVKVGAMAIGGLIVLDLFVGLIVLTRLALGV